MCLCLWVCVCGCVPYGAVVCAAISNREVAGSIPDDYGHTRLSSLSQTPPDVSFILLAGYQQPVHAGVCGMMCVREKNGKRPKSRDSLARKSHFTAVWCRPG